MTALNQDPCPGFNSYSLQTCFKELDTPKFVWWQCTLKYKNDAIDWLNKQNVRKEILVSMFVYPFYKSWLILEFQTRLVTCKQIFLTWTNLALTFASQTNVGFSQHFLYYPFLRHVCRVEPPRETFEGRSTSWAMWPWQKKAQKCNFETKRKILLSGLEQKNSLFRPIFLPSACNKSFLIQEAEILSVFFPEKNSVSVRDETGGNKRRTFEGKIGGIGSFPEPLYGSGISI